MGPAKKRRVSDDGAVAAIESPDDSQSHQKVVLPTDRLPEKSAAPPSHLRRQLFVRSLPATATSENLTEFFSESYPLKHATVVVDPITKQSKGYAFVTFADVDDAERAKEEFNGKIFQGRKIKVEVSEPRHRQEASNEKGTVAVTNGAVTAAAESRARRQQQEAEARRPPKLIIRNLPWSIKEPEQLAVLFRSFGKVKHATIPKTKPGLMAGFGFIVMRGKKNAEKALEAVNGKEIDGRTLAVDWAIEKEVWQGLQKMDDTAVEVKNADEANPLDGPSNGDDTSGLEQDNEPMADDAASSMLESAEDAEISEDDASELEGGGFDHSNDRVASQQNSSTIFIRNLPFTVTDELLREHFLRFGPVRYARIVLDHGTGRPKGTGFVCFYNDADATTCIREAPRLQQQPDNSRSGKKDNSSTLQIKHSILENELADPSGRYTFEGRVLQLSRAVARDEAIKLTEEGASHRERRDRDKRRLFLLSEGTISSDSPLYQTLAPSEVKMREASAKQRKTLIQSNPSLHLSLTRLSVRNIPRNIDSKALKALAREAVVGFAKDVKERKRQQLSKEEEARGGDATREAEKQRKAKGKGIVKQAKIVFEGREGGKVSEESGAGRSRGYGFIEYSSHRWALMGLRWLNGHALARPPASQNSASISKEDIRESKKRLIAEFAIENAQVVMRRQEREEKARERSKAVVENRANGVAPQAGKKTLNKDSQMARTRKGTKRKRDGGQGAVRDVKGPTKRDEINDGHVPVEREKLAKRNRIIAKKRMQRRSRKSGGSS
ncbi:MAG: RNA recognition motif-containing protein [Caeruleum heppii]|nr:MAG: RNA recognition motif-containing protein [Caeruleum heppii]